MISEQSDWKCAAERVDLPMSQAAQVKCPTCRKKGDWFARAYAPFCSRRCKLIDLGKWLGEEHTISDPLLPAHLEKHDELVFVEHLDRPEWIDRGDS